MKYTEPQLLVALAVTRSVASVNGGGGGKGGTCIDSHPINTSNGAYEVDE
jgi:hypothetical protein